MQQRFPSNVTYCDKCQQERKHYRINGRPVYSCDHCGSQISPMAGTIFEHSSTSLRLWYYAMYLMASTRCGISRKTDSARNWSDLQNCLADVPPDSLVAVRN